MTQELNDAIFQHFDNKIQNVKGNTLLELIKKKKITKDIQKQLIKLKKAYNAGNLDDVLDYGDFERPPSDNETEDEDHDQEEQVSQEEPVKSLEEEPVEDRRRTCRRTR